MVRVTSEIGRLRRVLVHEPGPEVDRMVPPMMEELLFDDILFGERAREEHGRFRRLMKLLDIDVVEARSLLAEALAQPEAQDWLTRVIQIEAPMEAEAAVRPPDIGTEAMLSPRWSRAACDPVTDDGGSGIEIHHLFRLTAASQLVLPARPAGSCSGIGRRLLGHGHRRPAGARGS
jgi:hypothetical protein